MTTNKLTPGQAARAAYNEQRIAEGYTEDWDAIAQAAIDASESEAAAENKRLQDLVCILTSGQSTHELELEREVERLRAEDGAELVDARAELALLREARETWLTSAASRNAALERLTERVRELEETEQTLRKLLGMATTAGTLSVSLKLQAENQRLTERVRELEASEKQLVALVKVLGGA